LAKSVAKHLGGAVYLDLERPSDVAKLGDAELYLESFIKQKKLIIIDEVRRLPALFPVLRSMVDTKRANGRFLNFLNLGSASPDLSRQSS